MVNLEFKELSLEIKELNDKGIFKGIASPFNNIDFGNDRVLPSVTNRNNNKTVPYLWQHNPTEPIGEVLLIGTNNGIEFEGKLYLDTLENGTPAMPNAYKAYTLMKNNRLKNSIGYKTLEYDYVKEGNETIRNLKDIDIMEVSAVTFPMNNQAAITSVKSQQKEVEKKMEIKAMGFADVLKVQTANEMRWKLQDALNASFRQLMEDENMTEEEKIAQLSNNVDEFATLYKENMTNLLKASTKNKVAKKEIINSLEVKMENERADELIPKKENTQITENTQEKKETDIIELKADELEALKQLHKNLVNKGEE